MTFFEWDGFTWSKYQKSSFPFNLWVVTSKWLKTEFYGLHHSIPWSFLLQPVNIQAERLIRLESRERNIRSCYFPQELTTQKLRKNSEVHENIFWGRIFIMGVRISKQANFQKDQEALLKGDSLTWSNCCKFSFLFNQRDITPKWLKTGFGSLFHSLLWRFSLQLINLQAE